MFPSGIGYVFDVQLHNHINHEFYCQLIESSIGLGLIFVSCLQLVAWAASKVAQVCE